MITSQQKVHASIDTFVEKLALVCDCDGVTVPYVLEIVERKLKETLINRACIRLNTIEYEDLEVLISHLAWEIINLEIKSIQEVVDMYKDDGDNVKPYAWATGAKKGFTLVKLYVVSIAQQCPSPFLKITEMFN